jgi:hypothetical protein
MLRRTLAALLLVFCLLPATPASGQRRPRHRRARAVRTVPTNTAPAGASALCRDGSYSFSAHRRGTCSHHGGVAQWLP